MQLTIVGLVALIACQAALGSEWQAPYDDEALGAEDQNDYKAAESLLTEACFQAREQATSASPKRVACSKHAEVQMLRREDKAADRTLQTLADALKTHVDAESEIVPVLSL